MSEHKEQTQEDVDQEKRDNFYEDNMKEEFNTLY